MAARMSATSGAATSNSASSSTLRRAMRASTRSLRVTVTKYSCNTCSDTTPVPARRCSATRSMARRCFAGAALSSAWTRAPGTNLRQGPAGPASGFVENKILHFLVRIVIFTNAPSLFRVAAALQTARGHRCNTCRAAATEGGLFSRPIPHPVSSCTPTTDIVPS
jgi:hypothetical protein